MEEIFLRARNAQEIILDGLRNRFLLPVIQVLHSHNNGTPIWYKIKYCLVVINFQSCKLF